MGKGERVPVEEHSEGIADSNATKESKKSFSFRRWWKKNLSKYFGTKKLKMTKSFDVSKIYWDADGNLRQGKSDRSREDELLALLEHDIPDNEDPNQVWIIIPSRWVRQWLLFAYHKLEAEPPGPINIGTLIKEDNTVEGGWRPKKTLKPPTRSKIDTKDYAKIEFEIKPGHFRRVSYEVWTAIINLYGQTEPKFCIAVRGNTELTPANDPKRWHIFQHPLSIDVSVLSDAQVVDEEKKARDRSRTIAIARLVGGGG